MYPGAQTILKDRVNKPVPLDPGQPRKAVGGNFDPEMGPPALAIPGMATMRLAFILDGQDAGPKRLFEFFPDRPGRRHKFSSPCLCPVDI